MRHNQAFRFSSYLTLTLATWCLAFADETFLPGMLLFAVPVTGLIWVAFALEGRWALSLYLSNLIGLVIAGGSGIWILLQITATPNQWFAYAPYPTALLPYGGPVLMVLMLGKLFRPKTIKDFWIVHSIGLIEMAMACILAGEPEFGFWFIGYLICCLWSLMLYYQCRGLEAPSSVRAARIRATRHRTTAQADEPNILLPWRFWGLGWAVRRTAGLGFLALVIFLLTPRFGNMQWSILNPGTNSQLQTGYPNSPLDLNLTGQLRVSEEVALEVYAEDSRGKPKVNLPADQRWRGNTLDFYHQGRWIARHLDLALQQGHTTAPVLWAADTSFPNFGPQQFFLTFSVDYARAGGFFLADPAVFDKDNFAPPVRSFERRWVPLFHGRDGTFILPSGLTPGRFSYQQVTLPAEYWKEKPIADMPAAYKNRLLQQPIPRIGTWTKEVLDRLVSRGRLQASDLATSPDQELGQGTYLLRENRPRVAQALTEFLASSGEFTYKLEMRRKNYSVDATEDFLCNIKEGFCEHFATGLVLMLRSVGIPARVVNGFRGAERMAEEPDKDGWYVVRQSHAHSWVEALLTRPGPDGQTEFFWRMLDPTPGGDNAADQGFSWTNWWFKSLDNGKNFWTNFIVGYSLEKQGEILEDIWTKLRPGLQRVTIEDWTAGPASIQFWFTPWPWLTLLGGLLGSYFLWRRIKARKGKPPRGRPTISVDFYDRFLKVIDRKWHLQPVLSQTPLEFSRVVTTHVQTSFSGSPCQDFPGYLVNLYYRVRFGNRPLEMKEQLEIDRKLNELENETV
jgi:protein-glutamine gamma-glutamyltransferase